MYSAAESLLTLFGHCLNPGSSRAESVLASRPDAKKESVVAVGGAGPDSAEGCCQVTPSGSYPRILFIRCRLGRVSYEDGIVYAAHPEDHAAFEALERRLCGGDPWHRLRRARTRVKIVLDLHVNTTQAYKLMGFSACDHKAAAYDD